MEKDKKTLTEPQMEEVAGGRETPATPGDRPTPIFFRNEPHCKSCRAVVIYIRGAYRCTDVNCELFNLPKTIDDVEWY